MKKILLVLFYSSLLRASERTLVAPSYWSLYTNDIFTLQTRPFDVFEKYFNAYGKKGDPINIWIPFVKNIIIFSHPDDLKEIFKLEQQGKLIKGSIIRDVQQYLLGDGVASIEPSASEHNKDVYQRLLRLYFEFFNPKQIKVHEQIITQWANEFLDYVESSIAKKTIDFEELSLNFTMGVICRTMFGYPITPDESQQIGKHLNTILNFIQNKMLTRPFAMPDFMPTQGNYAYAESLQALNDFIDKVWDFPRTYEENQPQFFIDAIKTTDFDEKTKRDQIKNIFFGGHETTAHLVAMSVVRLTQSPEWKEKIMQGEISLEAFINEVLRLDSPISIYGRENLEQLEINGIQVPVGSTLLFSQHNAHRLEEFWENPNEFNPARFMKKNDSVSRESFFPFGLGVRKCLGKYMSLMETKIFITEFVKKDRNWKLPKDWDPKVKLQCTSRIEGGIPMHFE